MYSQNDEEHYITTRFGDKVGTFLDIGAFDGVTFSNTRELALRGWKGVCLDGSPFSFVKLFDLYRDNHNVALMNCIVAPSDRLNGRIMAFWESAGSGASTVNHDNFKKWEHDVWAKHGHPKFREMGISVVTFREVLNWCKQSYPTFDFVNIDIEGNSTELGLEFDPDEFNTTMVCVEHDGNRDKLIQYYSSKGFSVMADNAENLIFNRIR